MSLTPKMILSQNNFSANIFSKKTIWNTPVCLLTTFTFRIAWHASITASALNREVQNYLRKIAFSFVYVNSEHLGTKSHRAHRLTHFHQPSEVPLSNSARSL